MSQKTINFHKPKSYKKLPTSKSPSSIISSSLYSGVASAERAIQKPRSPLNNRFIQSKFIGERSLTFTSESFPTTSSYHAWESNYNRLFTRPITKKCMTKDPYSPRMHATTYATEKFTTVEECSLVLIPANHVHIQQPIIHSEIKISLPNIVRHQRNQEVLTTERNHDILATERIPPEISTKKSTTSQLHIESKVPLPRISGKKSTGIAPTLATTNRSLTRAKMRTDVSVVIRRPKKRTVMDTVHGTMGPLAVYG